MLTHHQLNAIIWTRRLLELRALVDANKPNLKGASK